MSTTLEDVPQNLMPAGRQARPAISLDAINKQFRGLEVLRDISFEVGAGEFFGAEAVPDGVARGGGFALFGAGAGGGGGLGCGLGLRMLQGMGLVIPACFELIVDLLFAAFAAVH